MSRLATVTIVGSGNLARALAPALRRGGYDVQTVVAHSKASLPSAQRLARQVGARATSIAKVEIASSIVWFCVPDAQISNGAKSLSSCEWKGRVALHSSGALGSDELAILRRRGAAIGSAHPLMTFVLASQPSMEGVPFAIEGDPAALRVVRKIVRALRATAHPVRKQDKAAYHAWGTFASPLLTAFLATTQAVAKASGVNEADARRRMLPILRHTLENYARLGAPDSFSGPLVRGDLETVKKHWRALRSNPEAREVYRALAMAAMEYLPVKNHRQLRQLLQPGSSRRTRPPQAQRARPANRPRSSR